MNIDNQSINSNAAPRWIEMVQKQLIRENPSALPGYGVDGSYGPETVEWVEKFQSRKGLAVDGNAGPNTLATLRSAIDLLPGMDGRGIELLQKDLLYFDIQQSTVDGSYGPKTEQGVKDFQFLNNLEVDGFAGPNTLKTMDKYITDLIIQRGANGSHVRRIQNQLNEQSEVAISIAVDGSYGPGTKDAVETFQSAVNLNPDGIVTPRTMNLLDLEAMHPYTDEEKQERLESAGISSETVSQTTKDKYIQLVEDSAVFAASFSSVSLPKISNDVSVVRVNADTTLTDKIITVSGQVENNPNLNFYTHIDEHMDNIITHNVFDINGTRYSDLVKITSYDVMNEEVESTETSWVEIDNSLLETSLKYKRLEQESVQTAFSRGYEQWAICEGIGQISCAILLAGVATAGAGIACSAAWAFTTVVLSPDTCENIYYLFD
ncbi:MULTISPECIES: peptidoglycan-binding domain-containing protein [Salimicrobium]|uniref:Peptidoglycan binding-like domain-containing protein n=1 Tax=Salimicrobium humidisoli TaxID=2029857 RepID=A0ABX4HNL7_9BACI|nr:MULTISPECIES: peptidoglycan-binding protein [Salimicrobium]PBB04653.1 hypothetical protein CKW00_12955 [Salimicrobium humidisoli]